MSGTTRDALRPRGSRRSRRDSISTPIRTRMSSPETTRETGADRLYKLIHASGVSHIAVMDRNVQARSDCGASIMHNNSMNNAKALFNEKYSDVRLKCKDGKLLPVNRIIMSMNSEYFDSVLFGDVVENNAKTGNSSDGIFLPYESSVLVPIVEYLYTFELSDKITSQNVIKVFMAADEFKITALCQEILLRFKDIFNGEVESKFDVLREICDGENLKLAEIVIENLLSQMSVSDFLKETLTFSPENIKFLYEHCTSVIANYKTKTAQHFWRSATGGTTDLLVNKHPNLREFYSTAEFTSGKHCWDIEIVLVTNLFIGVVDAMKRKEYSGYNSLIHKGFEEGDVIRVWLDMDEKMIHIGKAEEGMESALINGPVESDECYACCGIEKGSVLRMKSCYSFWPEH